MPVNNELYRDFTQLVQQYERLIYKVCSIYTNDAEDSKDLFQEIVLQAWLSYPRFNHEAKFSTWLYRVALNTAINHIRKANRKPRTTGDEALLNHIAEQQPVTQTEEYKILQRLIGGLPSLEKALILLYLDDYSYQEIADIMGISVSNVGTRINRIKEKLKKQAQPFVQ